MVSPLRLLITARDNSRWIGTAFFVSPRVLVTAGHCVFIRSANPARHGWAKSIAVMPGRDGSNLPFGTHTSHRFYSVTGYTNSGSDEYDYGAIVLNSPVGLQTGRIGYGAYTDSTLTTSYGNISGYPGDRGGGSQQWYAARRIHSVSSRKLFYDTDTAGGRAGPRFTKSRLTVAATLWAFTPTVWGDTRVTPPLASPTLRSTTSWRGPGLTREPSAGSTKATARGGRHSLGGRRVGLHRNRTHAFKPDEPQPDEEHTDDHEPTCWPHR